MADGSIPVLDKADGDSAISTPRPFLRRVSSLALEQGPVAPELPPEKTAAVEQAVPEFVAPEFVAPELAAPELAGVAVSAPVELAPADDGHAAEPSPENLAAAGIAVQDLDADEALDALVGEVADETADLSDPDGAPDALLEEVAETQLPEPVVLAAEAPAPSDAASSAPEPAVVADAAPDATAVTAVANAASDAAPAEVATPPVADASPAPEAAEARPRMVRRSTLEQSEPLAPEIDPQTMAAAESQVAEEAVSASARPTIVRRRTTLGQSEEPLAPEVDPKAVAAAMAAEETTSTAAPAPEAVVAPGLTGAAAAINPPNAPTDPETGAPQVTAEMRQRSQGNFTGDAEETAAPDGTPKAPPKAGDDPDKDKEDKDKDKEDPEDNDPVPPIAAIDAIHTLLLAGLRKPRDARQAEVMSEIQELQSKRAESTAELARLRARQDQAAQGDLALRAAAAQAGPGARPGLFAGLGAGLGRGVGAVKDALTLTPDPEKRVAGRIAEIDQKIGAHQSYKRIALEGQFERTVQAADSMYRTHVETKQQVSKFNADLLAKPEGAKYVADLTKAAADAKISVPQMRERVFGAKGYGLDPAVAELRKQAEALLQDPELGSQVRGIERNSRLLSTQADRVARGIETASRNKVDVSALDGEFTDALEKMEGEDCLLARPGGDRLDKMRKQIAEMIENLVERIKSVFRRSGPSPAPGGP